MVSDFTIVAFLHERETIAGRERFSLAVLRVGKRVVARVDRGISIYADKLLSEFDGEFRQRLEGTYEVRLHPGRI